MNRLRRTLAPAPPTLSPILSFILLMIVFGLGVVFTGTQLHADRASCEQIRTACRNAGFVPGGGARDGLLADCFNPLVRGTPRPRATSLPLPKINPQLVNACRAGNDAAPPATGDKPVAPPRAPPWFPPPTLRRSTIPLSTSPGSPTPICPARKPWESQTSTKAARWITPPRSGGSRR